MNFQDICPKLIEYMGKYQTSVILAKWLWLISGLPTALKALEDKLAIGTSQTVLQIGTLRQKYWQARDFRAYGATNRSTPQLSDSQNHAVPGENENQKVCELTVHKRHRKNTHLG